MGKSAMKTPGAPGASRGSNGGTKRSPLAPTSTSSPVRMSVDDASSKVVKGTLRKKHTVADNDAALGSKGTRKRTATNASAQFRITSSLPGPQSPEAQKTLANGRTMPAVMGSKQNFLRGGLTYGPM